MLSNSLRRLAAWAAVAVLVAFFAVPASADDACVPLKGTITGHLRVIPYEWLPLPGLENHDWDGAAGWYGVAYLQFGQEPPVTMLLVDHGIEGTRKDWSGGWTQKEILTFKAKDAKETDFFKVHASYVATYRPGPSLHEFHEAGLIAESEGRFAGAKGWMKIDGLFTAPEFDPAIFDGSHDSFLWIAQVGGRYCGPR